MPFFVIHVMQKELDSPSFYRRFKKLRIFAEKLSQLTKVHEVSGNNRGQKRVAEL